MRNQSFWHSLAAAPYEAILALDKRSVRIIQSNGEPAGVVSAQPNTVRCVRMHSLERCEMCRAKARQFYDSLSFKAPGTFNDVGLRELLHPDFRLHMKQATRKIEWNAAEYSLCLQLHAYSSCPVTPAVCRRFRSLLSSQIADIREAQRDKGEWSLSYTVQEVLQPLISDSTPAEDRGVHEAMVEWSMEIVDSLGQCTNGTSSHSKLTFTQEHQIKEVTFLTGSLCFSLDNIAFEAQGHTQCSSAKQLKQQQVGQMYKS